MKNKVDVVVGLFWGDESKGRVVDNIANNYSIIARASGGSNAGHTLIVDDNKYVFRLLPSGILNKSTTSFLGGGMVINPEILEKELVPFPDAKVKVSENAHIVMPYHIEVDVEREKTQNIGTTKNGIGPTYECKAARIGLRVKDLFSSDTVIKQILNNQMHYAKINNVIPKSLDYYMNLTTKYAKIFNKYIESESFIRNSLNNGEKILAECAQGTFLDIDHGENPYVTSSSTTTIGVCNGLAISPKAIGKVIGVTKAYITRVGNGEFPTEISDTKEGIYISKMGQEFGAVTGRPRRVGWLDIQQLNKSIELNGVDELFLSKIDVLTGLDKIKILNKDFIEFKGWNMDISKCTNYNQLPQEVKNYVSYIQNSSNTPITNISVSPKRESTFNVII